MERMVTQIMSVPIGKYSVVRLFNGPNGEESIRLIGTYESQAEARFIAKKAEKMEKMSIMLRKLKEDPSLEGRISIPNIVLGDVTYEIRTIIGLQDSVSPAYTNGVSNVTHFMNNRNPHEKSIAKSEAKSNNHLSFHDFVMLREEFPALWKVDSRRWDLAQPDEGGDCDE